jgi:hypothetical protein
MHSVDPTTEQMIRSVLAYAENRLRLDPVPLDGIGRDPAVLDATLRGLLGDGPHNCDQVLGALLRDQVAFIPPSAWEGETVARFAFLHPHTSMDLVRQILDRME